MLGDQAIELDFNEYTKNKNLLRIKLNYIKILTDTHSAVYIATSIHKFRLQLNTKKAFHARQHSVSHLNKETELL